jgi:hypothetical protein
MEEWDHLNDETFGGGSDLSDVDNEDWQHGHHDFARQRGQHVPGGSGGHKGGAPRAGELSSANGAAAASTTAASAPKSIPTAGRSGLPAPRMPSEFVDLAMPFDMERDPMENKLARSFDDFFQDDPDDLPDRPPRARNTSESELFPDSYKFSPPAPSLNIGETIWNPCETPPQDENDYISNHIKALLNIQPKPKPKPEQSRVYTLEELESEASAMNIAPPPGLGRPQPQTQLPIGTPPKISHMVPSQFVCQREMAQHQQVAFAQQQQLRNQYALAATASMFLNNPSQVNTS